MGPVTPLVMESVGFRYGADPVLHEVSLRLEAGEGVALLGPNGAGKTTLTRLAMALRHPGTGRVVTVGRDTDGRRPEDLADVAGYLFQQPSAQLFERTVRAEIAFGPGRLGWPAGQVEKAVASVLEELGLEAISDQHPYDLPEPTRRLVALGAALVSAPLLLLLDEPTAGLDREARARVARVVGSRRAAGAAVLAVTHDLGFAVEALDRAVVLEHGRIREDAPLLGIVGRDAKYPAPPLLALHRRLGLGAVRPTVGAMAPLLTSHPETGTLEA